MSFVSYSCICNVIFVLQIETFKPFFVSLNLPYSVVRGEQVVLQANVFNYLSQDTDVILQSMLYIYKHLFIKIAYGFIACQSIYPKICQSISIGFYDVNVSQTQHKKPHFNDIYSNNNISVHKCIQKQFKILKRARQIYFP